MARPGEEVAWAGAVLGRSVDVLAYRRRKTGQKSCFTHSVTVMEYDVMAKYDPLTSTTDALLAGMNNARGPTPGCGRGPGRPWRGIVEETPALWVTWIAEAARRMGKRPRAITVGDLEIRIVSVPMHFGDRFYFVCPACRSRREALFFVGSRVGCRQCMRLGYRSQVHRANSPFMALDRLFSRRLLGVTPRYYPVGGVGDRLIEGVMADLRAHLKAKIDAMLEGVSVQTEGLEAEAHGETG